MGANYSFYVKTIETHARAFFKVIIFSIGSVSLELEWTLSTCVTYYNSVLDYRLLPHYQETFTTVNVHIW